MSDDKTSRIIQTAWLFWGFMMPGVGDAILGPTLLDLQLLVQESVDKFSFLILCTGVGAITGSLLTGFIFTSVNNRLKLALTIILGSVVNCVTPAVPAFGYFCVMFFLQGLSRGFAGCYLLEVCNDLWVQKGTPFQFIFCGATTGSILTPLIVRPFLCVMEAPDNLFFPPTLTANQTNDNTTACSAADTHVQQAYLVLGALTLPSGIAFIYYWLQSRRSGTIEHVSLYEDPDDKTKQVVKNKLHYLFLILLFFFFFPIVGNTMLYNTYLTVFGVEGPLHISKTVMMYMTSVFWGGLLVSRVGNMLLTRCCGNFYIILVNCTCLFVSGVTMLSLAGRYEEALWVTTLALGLFSGPYQGAALAWSENFIPLGPKIISLTFLGVGAGAMILPFAGGMLYHYVPPMGHMYLVFSMIVFLCLVFFLLNYVGYRIKMSPIRQPEIPLKESESE
ncbi:sodium-dependent glucose transporter 1-like [Haliotis rubra]|uniref:sodium-dependent glucose transporter 1-like n=1 Tax=Haliotis rubra TaxID=36100 RepID=UPI001EE60B35|nr:sodium-dependent glucose transporter 1-like [Haliotis rubra]XP_046545854.1 sodium-dependent glucose transporter 1-like [Haliotis rubra]XP_046545855.1 sodium-dependent glucose transporter 1-like [Haliotis rubra]XP_046545856.1 sodium-dependent glucose transporter 1-like [Haliotis rubra]XP_046545857.1 sodium-dependent glucose transporter 1-like [Haliotis rubra]